VTIYFIKITGARKDYTFRGHRAMKPTKFLVSPESAYLSDLLFGLGGSCACNVFGVPRKSATLQSPCWANYDDCT